MDIKNAIKQWLTEKENKRYAKRLQEKQVSYGRWIRDMEDRRDEDVESRNAAETEGAIRSTGNSDSEYVVFLASEGVVLYNAIKNIGCYLTGHPQKEIVYGDEDVCEPLDSEEIEPERKLPWFKPDWSPSLFLDYFYFGSAVAVRRSLLEEMATKGMPHHDFAVEKEYSSFWKKFLPEMCQIPLYRVTDKEAYQNWMCTLVEQVGGFRKGCNTIGHIPEIWFSCESEAEQKKFAEDWRRMPEAQGSERRLDFLEKNASETSISVVIPSKDNPEILEKCIRACEEVTQESFQKMSLEIIVVDNGSSEVNKGKIEACINEMNHGEQESGESREATELRITYLYEPMEFNFSKMCNLGASCAKGEFLLFLNDDVELCQAGTLEYMVALAKQEYTGAVGLKLLYPGTDKIQHAGITNLPMGPVHKLQFKKNSECYYFNTNRGNRNVLAVTAACLMVEKKKFEEAGGFSEELRVAFNDVDFCFRLYELGYHNVCGNDKYAYHHESLSRGADESADKLNRLLMEREKLYARHPRLEGVDPYYSVHLNRDGLDTNIRPGYLTSHNQTRRAVTPLRKMSLAKYRQDACLMVRVEDFRVRKAVGYGVVLGDNNACYDKALVLQVISSGKEGMAYELPVSGQYRPDLEENMPDQVNVALSGYDVEVGDGVIPKGTYRIGMAAKNRVTGLKLVNWTNRYVEL